MSELRVGDPPATAPLLQLSGLSKAYGSTVALRDADLRIENGEIHGLLGQNGSGKSTLIKILAGVVEPDSGRLELRGENIPLPLSAAESERLGLRFVHQNLGLVDSLTVAENLFLSRFALGHRPIDWRSFFDAAEGTLEEYGIRVSPRAVVGALSPLEKAQVAIARAVAPLRTQEGGARNAVLVLDEPTVYLPKNEVTSLFALLHRVVAVGHGVLLVTHRLEELLEHSARVSILRDARVIDTLTTSQTTEDELVELAVGAGWRKEPDPRPTDVAPASSQVRRIAVTGLRTTKLRGIDLTLQPAQIHGFTGLAGSGYEEVLYALFGRERSSGTLTGSDGDVDLASLTTARAIDSGIALVPVDRLTQGVAASASIEESLSLPVIRQYFRGGRLRLRDARTSSRRLISEYAIVCSGSEARVDTLSGGNQQKVLLAKWLQRQPALLLLHEPTQGVDVRARQEIWAYVRSVAATAPVLLASSDYDELASLCTCVSIIAEGRIHKTLTGDGITADVIAAECLKGPDRRGARDEGGTAA